MYYLSWLIEENTTGKKLVLVVDNSSTHTSRRVIEFLEERKELLELYLSYLQVVSLMCPHIQRPGWLQSMALYVCAGLAAMREQRPWSQSLIQMIGNIWRRRHTGLTYSPESFQCRCGLLRRDVTPTLWRSVKIGKCHTIASSGDVILLMTAGQVSRCIYHRKVNTAKISRQLTK